jgi:esterase/lipase superfamily enzyme
MRPIVIAFIALAVLSSCTARGSVRIDPSASSSGEVERVFIGTTRADDIETGEAFGHGRLGAGETRFARLDVAVPPDRKPGEISWPRPGRPADLSRDFVATGQVAYGNDIDFGAALRRELSLKPAGQREAIIYVHGFNTTFAEGAFRLAQLSHDLELDAALVHYSWPSLGHPLGYAYDRDSILIARDGLQTLLDEVASAGADRILITAHSLGSFLTMEVLRQMAIAGDRRVTGKLAGVVLFSPDIDVDVFHAQVRAMDKLPQPFIIFTSQRDRALQLSAILTGQRDRLGNIEGAGEVADLQVTVLDTTAFNTGSGHFNAAHSPLLLAMLGQMADTSAVLGKQGNVGLLSGAVLTVQNATQVVLTPMMALSGPLP